MSEVQRALDLAEERGADALQAMRGQWEALTLAETITAYASCGEMLEQLWGMAGLLLKRTEQIRADERAERPGGAATRLIDAATPHLGYGREAVMLGYHLFGLGRAALGQMASNRPVEGEAAEGGGCGG